MITDIPLIFAAGDANSPMWGVLFQILVVIGAALVSGMVFERFKQSAILGYLVAGMILGPGCLGIVSEKSGVAVMAELGVSLLLFAIGLEFSAKRLMRLGPIAIGGGCLQVGLTLTIAALVAKFAGLDWKPAIAIGAAVSLSSTACVLRLLIDRAEIDSVHGRTILGILLLQDVAVVPLVLLVTMLGGGGTIAQMGIEMSKAVGLIIVLIAGFLALSRWVLPRALKHLSMSRDRELLVLLAVFLAIGSAWAAHSFHLSPALGAFIAGMMLAESPFATQIRSDIGALRILFVTLFFMSVGMLGDPVWMSQHFIAVGIVTLAVMLGKCLIISLITFAFRLPIAYAFASGAALAQVGEFGIVIAGIANGSELFDEYLFHLIVSSILVSLLVTPFLVNFALAGGRQIQSLIRKEGSEPSGPSEPVPHEDDTDRVILIGFGPSGQNVGSELLRRENTQTLVIDFRASNVDLARSMGFKAEPGDATNMEFMIHHGVSTAKAIVISIPDHRTSVQITQSVRAINPSIAIVVRARYHSLVPDLEEAGATAVIDEEYFTGKRLATAVRALI